MVVVRDDCGGVGDDGEEMAKGATGVARLLGQC